MSVVFLEWFLYLFLNYSDGSSTGGREAGDCEKHKGGGAQKLRGAQCCGSAGCKHLALAPRPNLNIVESPTERFKKEVSSIF